MKPEEDNLQNCCFTCSSKIKYFYGYNISTFCLEKDTNYFMTWLLIKVMSEGGISRFEI